MIKWRLDLKIFDPSIIFICKVSDEEIEEAFKMFDRDNSGSINHNEVK